MLEFAKRVADRRRQVLDGLIKDAGRLDPGDLARLVPCRDGVELEVVAVPAKIAQRAIGDMNADRPGISRVIYNRLEGTPNASSTLRS